MNSFFIRIDSLGNIKDVFWSDPVYLVTKFHTNIYEIFSLDSILHIKNTLNSFDNNNSITVNVGLKEEDRKECLTLKIKKVLDDYVVLGYSVDNKDYMIEKLLTLVSENYYKDTSINQYEQIQRLNNKLINTKRLLEKTNIQLNQANLELNNRLVEDSLTGLISRYQFWEEMKTAISKNQEKYGVFFFIDIDDFKSVNDRFGHSFGDKYLIEFANRLKNIPIADILRIRISGDEFGLFVYDLDNTLHKEINEIWDSIKQNHLSEQIEIDGYFLDISISAGAAVYGKDTFDTFQLVDFADFAMYKAKQKGKNNLSIFEVEEYKKSKGIHDEFYQGNKSKNHE